MNKFEKLLLVLFIWWAAVWIREGGFDPIIFMGICGGLFIFFGDVWSVK